ncbi:MAG: chorismate-binding protein, partial [Polyangiaceae bacterium]
MLYDIDPSASGREFVARILTDIDGQPITAAIAIPVPYAPLSTFLREAPRADSVLWDPRATDNLAYATRGVAHKIEGRGPERFKQVGAELEALWKRTKIFSHPDCPIVPPPRVFGGFGFHPGFVGPPWDDFSDGCLILPRWQYARHQDHEHVALILVAHGDRDQGLERRSQIMAELDDILMTLSAFENESTHLKSYNAPPTAGLDSRTIHQLPFADWQAHIVKIQEAIRSGKFQKIVAARRADVDLPSAVDDIDVATQLSAEPGCTRYAFRGANSSFVGASPEILFHKSGLELTTQALAGTLKSLGSDVPVLSSRSLELLESKKDRAEHEFVVDEIRRSLSPYCDKFEAAERPSVSKIRTILHLNTPIVARLRDDISVMDLVAALHPTPAVGGAPKRQAAEWIAEHATAPRGWYTG